ncbi:hypothetical protein [Streptomyces lavendulae]|uniref:hypothetical protein n=1 Tax=Streptomyces lavendulae TaxID=1914 RepID=UPI0024A1482B|nr:hypothetical protein [Streptomyces lavendulae]GLX18836.1 hypothetical protein Slala01_24800 [Streptomyces lavendulae subsp. lavendulae]GLX29242.1 hypothetical protein Slala02_50620 [Streptomyces lavendulae subsp. lavendulae]
MSILMRAPRESGSWFWDLYDVSESGLEPALATAARMTAVLSAHGLLEPQALEWSWFEVGKGGLGIDSSLSLISRSLSDEKLGDEIRGCRPVGHPGAEMTGFVVVGSGTWYNAEGDARKEERLVELRVSPDSIGPSATLSVHHDVWATCDFYGNPHPEVHARNAPRLATALRELDALLGVDAEPGEPTYFGMAKAYGLEDAELIDGRGPDLTDLM